MTAGKASDTRSGMGRPKIDADEQLHIRVWNGWTARIRAALEPGETVTDFIRDAIAAKLKRRERKKGPTGE